MLLTCMTSVQCYKLVMALSCSTSVQCCKLGVALSCSTSVQCYKLGVALSCSTSVQCCKLCVALSFSTSVQCCKLGVALSCCLSSSLWNLCSWLVFTTTSCVRHFWADQPHDCSCLHKVCVVVGGGGGTPLTVWFAVMVWLWHDFFSLRVFQPSFGIV